MPTRGAPPLKPTPIDADTLPTGVALLDEALSGKGLKRGELSIFVSGLPLGTDKTMFWRQLVERHGSVSFDFEMAPEFGPEDMGLDPPGDNTTKPGS